MSNNWETLYSVVLYVSDNRSKVMKLGRFIDNPNYLLMDIRHYRDGKQIPIGVCLTEFEYDWMVRKLCEDKEKNWFLDPAKQDVKHDDFKDQEVKSRHRSVELKPQSQTLRNNKVLKTVRIILKTEYDGKRRTRSVKLHENEISDLVDNYGSILQVLQTIKL